MGDEANKVQRVFNETTVRRLMGRLRSFGEPLISATELMAEFEKCREALRRRWADLKISSTELTTSVRAIESAEEHILGYIGRNHRAISGGVVRKVEATD